MDTDELFDAIITADTERKGEADPGSYSPLCLAYLGDSVFELLVRMELIRKGITPVDELNRKAREYVKAGAQADMYYRIFDILTEEEELVIKRGRNAKAVSKARHATVTDYRHATGLEALFGYLYMKKRPERLIELFHICMSGSGREEETLEENK